jgi:hypothetical protein
MYATINDVALNEELNDSKKKEKKKLDKGTHI